MADVVEAMSSHHPYRPPYPIEEVLAELERAKGEALQRLSCGGLCAAFPREGLPLPIAPFVPPGMKKAGVYPAF